MSKFHLQMIVTTFFLIFMSNLGWAGNTSTDRMSLIKTSKNFTDKQGYSTIKITYPVIKNIPHQDKLNQEINQIVDGIVQKFKQDIADNQPLKPIADLPLNVDSNTLGIDYKTFSATQQFISIRFSIYTFFYGAAHPLTVYESLNFDVNQGKVLTLDDVFKSSDYLQFLSNYSKDVLTKNLAKAVSANTEPFAEGLKPVPENFKVWNLTPNGLLITFPPYQVAAYAFGPQEVLVPYAEIKDKLRITYS